MIPKLTHPKFRRLYKQFRPYPLPREVWDTPEYMAWIDHLHECASCSDWYIKRELRERGVGAAKYPCIHVAYYATTSCPEHNQRPAECPDVLIQRSVDKNFGLRRADGDLQMIRYCPWCGIKLRHGKKIGNTLIAAPAKQQLK